MPDQRTIPMLPCASITDVLDFYTAMGFEITYQQQRPNNYGCVKYEDIDLHFFSMKGFEPVNSYSSCLVLVPDADALHGVFESALRANLGKVPLKGIPRITKPSNKNAAGDWRFNVIDPGGNWIRFIQQGSPIKEAEAPPEMTSALARAVYAADLLANAKGDFAAAAAMLDKALAKDNEERQPVDLVRALALRAEVAANMDQPDEADRFLVELRAVSLTDEERLLVADELNRIADLFED